jgi:cell division transport system ATP-binding protein
MTAPIELIGVSQRFGPVDALSDVTASIGAGTVTIVQGPTGSGKTTLLELIHGSTKPTTGACIVAGVDVGRLRARHLPRYRSRVALVPQHHRLLDDRSGAANVTFGLRAHGWGWRAATRRTDELLAVLDLGDIAGRRPSTMSGGERQQISLARAIATDPLVLLADEPTGNLDPDATGRVMRLLDLIAERGTTVVMSTHDVLIRDSSRPTIALDNGRLVTGSGRGVLAPPTKAAREMTA